VFLLAVTIVALAFGAAGQLHHPHRVAIAIAAALVVGSALLYEFGVAK
jgi:hypothetical protein